MSAEHILVVDDEPDIRGLLKEILEDEGFEVGRRHGRPGANIAPTSSCWTSGCRTWTASRC